MRTALLLLVPLALLAAGSDWALWSVVRAHYAKYGHFGVRVDIAVLSVALTALSLYVAIGAIRELRRSHPPGRMRKRGAAD